MSERGGVGIDPASWDRDDERAEITAIRRVVFSLEQGVPVDIELDGRDADSRHLLARDAAGTAIGTARMQATGHIGRIAVLRAWRGHRVGARLVESMIDIARGAGLHSVDLDAQTHALGFYVKLGFAPRGEVFLEAGIEHQNMQLTLD